RVGRWLVAGFSAVIDPVEDGAKLAMQGDDIAAALFAGGDDDVVDDLSAGIGGFECVLGI
uniref:hypothetical protein n=1 Tax=Serratia marcescens TaxID=615 RepID=UPI0019531296